MASFPSELRKKRFKLARQYGYGTTGGYGFGEPRTPSATIVNAETTALLARMSAQTEVRKGLIDSLITGGKAHGWWSKLDFFDVLAANDQASCLLNWKGTSFTPSLVGTWTFTADRGLQRTTVGSHIVSGLLGSTGVNFVSNSNGIYIYTRTAARAGGTSDVDWGDNVSVTTTFLLQPRGPTDNLGIAMQSANAFFSATVLDASGLWSVTRTGSGGTAVTCRRNKAAVALTGSNVSTAMGVNSLNFGRNGTAANSTATGREYCMIAAGGPLTAAESDFLYDDLTVYLTALGAAV